jgi:hypothetical protein
MFVTGQSTGVIAEISATTGAVIARIGIWSSPQESATAIATGASHLWLTTSQDSVVEQDVSTGATVPTLNDSLYKFDGADAITLRAGQAWMANNGDNSATECTAPSGLHWERRRALGHSASRGCSGRIRKWEHLGNIRRSSWAFSLRHKRH